MIIHSERNKREHTNNNGCNTMGGFPRIASTTPTNTHQEKHEASDVKAHADKVLTFELLPASSTFVQHVKVRWMVANNEKDYSDRCRQISQLYKSRVDFNTHQIQ